MQRWTFLCLLWFTPFIYSADGNRFVYLDENDPYYVSRTFPKLTTPQWIGEDGVEAVVILAIDDMRDHNKYETYLRPILKRLKKIDGRAPVSIMTNRIDPKHPHLQTWLKEGVSLETHTYDHPCPFFKLRDFDKAKSTYDRCIDLMCTIPNSKPVAFRMPCCDSLNTPSPRFYAEMFNRTTPKGNFLTIDTSVFHFFTPNDPELPRELVLEDGRDRFAKYMPRDRTFVNTIHDYPYPYVLGRLCWQFPCMAPSDWLAQHLHKPNNAITIRDWKAALDATVIKKGTFSMVFHPHGWIRNDQIVELIDHAAQKHGKKVKFLTFREAQERLDKHLLAGHPIRHPKHGGDNGVRILDLNDDGYLDVVIGNDKAQKTRIWQPKRQTWKEGKFPVDLAQFSKNTSTVEHGFRFGVLKKDVSASLFYASPTKLGAWHFDGTEWIHAPKLIEVLKLTKVRTVNEKGIDQGVRLRDFDHDGLSDVLISSPKSTVVAHWGKDWKKLGILGVTNFVADFGIVDKHGRDNGVRFIDINEDGYEDILISNDKQFGLFLYTPKEPMKGLWTKKIFAGKRDEKAILPPFVRDGKNNGAWFHSRSLWIANEATPLLKDHVYRLSFNDMLKDLQPGPKEPQASLKCMQARPGFTAELMASEPLVQDPIAFEWGPDGKFWVVEMTDYPNGTDGKGKAGGRVKYLEDTNDDGQYDRATLFLKDVPFPTGVMPWGKGIIVSAAPEIFYAEDTNNDGKADVRKTLYVGFGEGNQQHRVNGFTRGLDNWIHVANGDSGGQIKSAKTGKVINIGGRDLRIRPSTGAMEAQSGQAQFGRNRDDWGNWFGCNNSNPMFHYVLQDHYLKRNPGLPVATFKKQISNQPGAAPVFPISRPLPRFNDYNKLNRFTSACSVNLYRDDLFGSQFYNNAFICEPVHNLVHREIMKPDGSSFTSYRAVDELKSEFLRSSDNWFRPTMVKTGPDGALWVADFYRHVIEHPKWIPQDWQKKLDLRAGSNMGRIYRVYPIGKKPRRIPRLERMNLSELVKALDSSNGWQRDTVQQLLIEKNDKSSIPHLEKLARESKRPLAKIHALCTLEGLNALSAKLVMQSLKDKHPGVRRHAVRLSEPLLKVNPALGKALTFLVNDDDAQVRMQLAYTLGEWNDSLSGEALAKLMLAHPKDKYLIPASFSSIHQNNASSLIVTVLRAKENQSTKSLLSLLIQLAVRQKNHKAVAELLTSLTPPDKSTYELWQVRALAGFLDAAEQQGLSLSDLKSDAKGELKTSLAQLDLTLSKLTKRLQQNVSVEARIAMLRLLGRQRDTWKSDAQTLTEFLSPSHPPLVQQQALTSLARLNRKEIPELLLSRWSNHSPALRAQILDVMLREGNWRASLLEALKQKRVSPLDIGAAHRQFLIKRAAKSERELVTKLLGGSVNPDRAKVLLEYATASKTKGDVARGRALFQKTCAACHRVDNVGTQIGADLNSLSSPTDENLLIAILDPNRAVEAKFVGYEVRTKRGQTFTGVLTNESSTSITMVGTDGKQRVVLRSQLEQIKGTGQSAMPVGFEKDINVQQMADLLTFLRQALSKKVPKKKAVP